MTEKRKKKKDEKTREGKERGKRRYSSPAKI